MAESLPTPGSGSGHALCTTFILDAAFLVFFFFFFLILLDGKLHVDRPAYAMTSLLSLFPVSRLCLALNKH